MNIEILKKVYESASTKFDMPPFNRFLKDMEDERKVSDFRESMSKHFDVPDLEIFKVDIGFAKENDLKKNSTSNATSQEEGTDFMQNQGVENGSLDSFQNNQSEIPTINIPQVQTPEFDIKRHTAPVESIENIKNPVGKRYGANTETGEKNTWLEEMVGKNTVTDFFGDMWRAGVQGVGQGATIDDAINLYAKGSSVSEEDLQEYITAVEDMDSIGMSDEMRSFNRIYENKGGGLLGFVTGVATNPSVLGQLFVSSIASMVNPAVAAGAAAGAAVGAGTGAAAGAIGGPLAAITAAAGAGTGALMGAGAALETGLSFTEFLKEEVSKKGMSFNDEGIRSVLEDPEALQSIRNRSASRGLVIGTVDGLTRGLAGQLGGKAVKAAKQAGRQVTKEMAAKAGLKAAGIEAIGGSTGETAARIVTGQELDVAEIGFEGVTGQASSILSVPQAMTGKSLADFANEGLRVLKPQKYGIKSKGGVVSPQTRQEIEDMLDTMTAEEIEKTQFEVKNDPELQKKITDKKELAVIDSGIPAYIEGDDRVSMANLEKELRNIEGSSLEVNKKRSSDIKNELRKITDKYEGVLYESVSVTDENGNVTQSKVLTTRDDAIENLEAEGIVDASMEQINSKQQQLFDEAKQKLTSGKVSQDIVGYSIVLDEDSTIPEGLLGQNPFRISEDEDGRAVVTYTGEQLVDAGLLGGNPSELSTSDFIDAGLLMPGDADVVRSTFKVDEVAEVDDIDIDITETKTPVTEDIDSGVTVEESLDKKGYSTANFFVKGTRVGEEGMITIDEENKNTLVFKTNTETIELGTIEEASGRTLSELGISLMPPEGVDVSPDGNIFTEDGVEYTFVRRSKDKKGEPVVTVKEVEGGLIEKFTGDKAERILKDLSLRKTKKGETIKLKVEGKETPTTIKKEVPFLNPIEAQAIDELDKTQKDSAKDVSEFEDMAIQEAIADAVEKDLVEVNGNVFQVGLKKDRSYAVSQMREDGKLVGIKDKGKRSKAIKKFKSEKTKKEKKAIRNAEKLIKDFKAEEDAKIAVETERVEAVMKQVENARKALGKVGKDVEIVYHETDESYRKATGEESRYQSTNGSYDNKVIHINGTKAKKNTVAHEVFHALLLRTGITNEQAKAITDRMLKAVKKTASPELLQKIKDHADKYILLDKNNKAVLDNEGNTIPSPLQSEESIAELFGLLASEYPQMDAPTQSIVKLWLDKIAKLLGLKPFTDAEVIDLLNVVSAKVEAGQEITEQDIEIFKVEELDASDVGVPGAEIAVTTGREQITNESIKKSINSNINVDYKYDFIQYGRKIKLPKKEKIQSVLDKSGGYAVFINSDGTKVGIRENKDNLDGGWQYVYIEENQNNNIGFAATSETHVKTFYKITEELKNIRDTKSPADKGKPIAVFVTVQNGETMLGEWYAGQFFFEGIDKAITEKKFKLETFKKLMTDAVTFRVKINEAKKELRELKNQEQNEKTKKKIKVLENRIAAFKKKSLNKETVTLLDLINSKKFETHKGRIEIAKIFASKKFTFGYRVNLLKNLIPRLTANGNNSEIKKALLDVNYGRKEFYEEHLDESLLETLNKTNLDETSIGGITLGGFFMNPYISKNEFFENRKKGINHAQFNESFSSNGKTFRLDNAHNVNELNPLMGYPTNTGYQLYNKDNNTNLNKSNTGISEMHTIVEFLNSKYGQSTEINGEKRNLYAPPFTSIGGSMYTASDREISTPKIETRKGREQQDAPQSRKQQDAPQIDKALSKASGTTQVATTTGSYVKAANIINDLEIKGEVLDYGAGLGLGTDAMSKVLGTEVDSYELNPERWKGKTPVTYTKASDISKQYDAIVSLNVLNVVPKDVRDFIVEDIYKNLKPGGVAVISSRGFKGDIANAKNFEKGSEDKSYIIKRKKGGKVVDVYQKGFDGNELVEYVQDLLGDKVNVYKKNTFGNRGIIVEKNTMQSRKQMPGGKPNASDTVSKLIRLRELLIKQGFEGSPAFKQVRSKLKEIAKKRGITLDKLLQPVKDVSEPVTQTKPVGGKRPPSAKKILGIKDKKITVNERVALKDQIKLEVKAARDSTKAYKNALKNIAGIIKGLQKKGKITEAKTTAITSRLATVNVYNKKSVDNLLSYVDAIFTKANLAEKLKRANALRKSAKKNSKSKVGVVDRDLSVGIKSILEMNPYIIPLNKLDSYLSFLEEFGASSRVLSLKEKGETIQQVNDIINAVNEVTDIDDNLTIEGMAIPEEYNVEENVREAKDIRITDEQIEKISDSKSRDMARALSKLTLKEIKDLARKKRDGSMDYSPIETLKAIKKNIQSGFFPTAGMKLFDKVDVNRRMKIKRIIAKTKREGIYRNIRNVYQKIKSTYTKKSFLLERIRSNNLFYIDDVLGNYNSKELYNNTFERLGRAFENYTSKTKKDIEKINDADRLIEYDGLGSARKKSRMGRSRNAIVKSKYKIRMLQLQREYLSNFINGKPNKKTPSALAFIDATLKEIKNEGILSVNDEKILKELKAKFLDGDQLSLEKLDKSLSQNERKALALYDEVNNSLAEKALFVSTMHGSKIDLINNYTHHAVILTAEDAKENILTQTKNFVKVTDGNTKTKTIIERTNGAKPISFDPSYSAIRAAQQVNMDYYVTQTVKQVGSLLNKIKSDLENDPEASSMSVTASRAMISAFNEVSKSVFIQSFSDKTLVDDWINTIKRIGYQSALSSLPRASSELVGNFGMFMSDPPKALRALKDFGTYTTNPNNGEQIFNVLSNLESATTSKLIDADVLTGKYSNMSSIIQPGRDSGEAVNALSNAMGVIVRATGLKQTAKMIDTVANKVLSYPDQVLSRPLWFGSFADSFAESTGIKLKPKDFDAIADGTSKYLSSEFKEARDKAVTKADNDVTVMSASSNPFMGTIKNQPKQDDSGMMAIYKMANSYMQKFTLFEYGTARNAISALYNQGELSKKQAIGLLAGVTFRMSSYMVLYSLLTNLFDDELFNVKDDRKEEEDIEDVIVRQLVGSVLGLITGGTLGNIARIPINFLLEYGINEPYLKDFRKGEYDPFVHSMVFSQINQDDLLKGDIIDMGVKVLAGPYSPLIKTLKRSGLVISKSITSKKRETREKYKKELEERMLIEVLGNLGMMPFYKDIRRIILKDMFGDKKKSSKKTKSRRESTRRESTRRESTRRESTRRESTRRESNRSK